MSKILSKKYDKRSVKKSVKNISKKLSKDLSKFLNLLRKFLRLPFSIHRLLQKGNLPQIKKHCIFNDSHCPVSIPALALGFSMEGRNTL